MDGTFFSNGMGCNVDRGVDESWEGAAEREYREEVNPAKLPEWSWKNACDGKVSGHISIQDLMKPDNKQNMSRPCVNFLLARANPQFVRSSLEKGEHPKGGRKIPLPEDFVTHLPLGTGPQRDILPYWRDTKLPFLEHDRLLWFPLDLKAGEPCAERVRVHNYLWIVAGALQIPPVSQDKGVPRQNAEVGPCIQKILDSGEENKGLADKLLADHLQACVAAGPGQHGGKDGQDGQDGKSGKNGNGKGAGSSASFSFSVAFFAVVHFLGNNEAKMAKMASIQLRWCSSWVTMRQRWPPRWPRWQASSYVGAVLG